MQSKQGSGASVSLKVSLAHIAAMCLLVCIKLSRCMMLYVYPSLSNGAFVQEWTKGSTPGSAADLPGLLRRAQYRWTRSGDRSRARSRHSVEADARQSRAASDVQIIGDH